MTDSGLKLTLKALVAIPVGHTTSDEKVRLWLASPSATSDVPEAGHLGFFPPETFVESAEAAAPVVEARTLAGAVRPRFVPQPTSSLVVPAPAQATTFPRTISKKEKPMSTCPRKMVRSGVACHRPIHKYNMCAYHLSQWRKNHHPMLKHP